jgi:hypothetical protein
MKELVTIISLITSSAYGQFVIPADMNSRTLQQQQEVYNAQAIYNENVRLRRGAQQVDPFEGETADSIFERIIQQAQMRPR